MFGKLGLKGQILIPLCTFITIILLGLTSIILVKQNQIAEEQAIKLANAIGQKYGSRVKSKMDEGMTSARMLAHTLQALKKQSSIEKLNRKDLLSILKTQLKQNKGFFGTYTAWEPNALDGKDNDNIEAAYHDKTGRFVPYLSRTESGDIHIEPLAGYEKEGDGDYYLLPRKTKEEQLLAPYPYQVSGKTVLLTSLVVPILAYTEDSSASLDFVGITGVDFTLDQIQEMVNGIKLFEGGFAYLISNQGNFIAHPNKELIGKSVTKRTSEDQRDKIINAITSGKSYEFFWTHPDGTEFIQVLNPVQIGQTKTPWSLGIAVPIHEVTKSSRGMAILFYILSILAIIFLSIIGFISVNRITKRIFLSVNLAQKIARGDLSHKFNIKGKSELATLAYALKDMVISLRKKEQLAIAIAKGDLTQNIELASEEDGLGKALQTMQGHLTDMLQIIQQNAMSLSTSLTELSAISNQMSNATTEMSSQSNTVAGASEEMSAGIRTLSSSTSEMNANVQSIAATSTEVSQNMTSISSGIEDLSGAIRQVSDKSVNAQSIAQQAIETSNHSTEKMNELDQSASKIGEFSQIIKEIAQQTNLLALNANIEAASAGEAGKGFAVVANEIKELANQSSKSAEDISVTISEIQTNTESSVDSMKDVAKIIESIDQSTKEILDLAQNGSENVNQMVHHVKESSLGVEEVSKLVNEISVSTESSAQTSEEFSASIAEITRNMQELNKVVSETATGVNQVSTETRSLSQVSEDMRQVVLQFNLKQKDEFNP